MHGCRTPRKSGRNVSQLLSVQKSCAEDASLGYQGMRSMKVRFALFFLSLMSLAGAASAADIPAPVPAAAPVYVPPRAVVYNWTGFYVGAMGGYGWSSNNGNDLKGGFAGGTIGGNAQFGNFVVGVEAEGAWADINQSASAFFVTATDRIQAFGSLTGRVGVALDNVLIYGK